MGITEATLAAYHVLATAFDDPTNGGTGKDEPMIWTVNYGKGRSLYMSWKWWYKEVVGGKYLLQPDGAMPASTFKHDEEQCVKVVTKHPIAAGLGTLHLWDETYKGMWISPDVKVLLRTDNPTRDGPLAWINPYPKSRVVYIELGHGQTAHLHPAYRTLVQNAVRWSARRLAEPGK
jgi:hypothetical protein